MVVIINCKFFLSKYLILIIKIKYLILRQYNLVAKV